MRSKIPSAPVSNELGLFLVMRSQKSNRALWDVLEMAIV